MDSPLIPRDDVSADLQRAAVAPALRPSTGVTMRRPYGRTSLLVEAKDNSVAQNDPGSTGASAKFPLNWIRAIDRALGPRPLEAATRVLTVAYAVILIVPDGYETYDVGYIAFMVALGVLIAASGWRPGTVAAITPLAFIAFNLIYPLYLNPFNAPLQVAAAVLLSQRRWRAYLLAAGGLAVSMASSYVLRTIDIEFAFVSTLTYTFITMSFIGVGGALMQKRIDNEIERRELAARAHDQELADQRRGMLLDTHDTISHALATESAIMRVLSRGDLSDAEARTLSELILVNARAQRQFRHLLDRTGRGTDQVDPQLSLMPEIRAASDGMSTAAAPVGIDLSIEIEPSEITASRGATDTVISMFYEFGTNITKHADGATPATLQVFIEDAGTDKVLVLQSRNGTTSETSSEPFSLRERTEQMGGSLDMKTVPSAHSSPSIVVRAALPLSTDNQGAFMLRSKSSLERQKSEAS